MSRAWTLSTYCCYIALAWVAAWLPLGLYYGPLTVALHRQPYPSVHKAYLIILYVNLLIITLLFARSKGLKWGNKADFFRFYILAFFCWLVTDIGFGFLLPGSFSWSYDKAIILAFFVSVAVAFSEELVFRGVLLTLAVEKLGLHQGTIASCILFATVHLLRPGGWVFKLFYGIGLFLAGYLLCYLTQKTSGLYASIGAHAAWIFLNTTDWGWVPEPLHYQWVTGLEGEAIAGLQGWLAMFLLFWFVQSYCETAQE